MAQYPLLRTGSTGAEVKKLQQALENAGYSVGSTGVDGIYGKNTAAAVRRYQQDQGLQVDAIAGQQTLSRLYGTAAATPETEQEDTGFTVSTFQPGQSYQTAVSRLEQHRAEQPQYSDSFRSALTDLEQRMQAKPESYPMETDPIYRQMAAAAGRAAKDAMEDTAGQLAHFSGGYGNTYAAVAGQQQYQRYLEQLGAAAPEYAALVRSHREDKREQLQSEYDRLLASQKQEYQRYTDALAQHLAQEKQYAAAADSAYEQELAAWKQAESEKKAAWSRLEDLISGTGYIPTAAEMTAAGMTGAQRDALLRRYTAKYR